MPRSRLFLTAIERDVHSKRPRLRHRDGTSLLAEMMATIASDAPQRWQPEPLEDRAPHDAKSLKAQRFLLRHLANI